MFGFAPLGARPIGAGGLEAGPAPLTATLTDDFDDNSRDIAKWNLGGFYEGTSTNTATVNEANQRLEVTPAASMTGSGGYVAVSNYDFVDSSVYVKLANVSSFSAHQGAYLSVGADAGNYYTMLVAEGLLLPRTATPGNNSNHAVIAYSATDHAWLRLRHSSVANTIHFEVAPSTASNPPAPGDWVEVAWTFASGVFGLNPVKIAIGSATYSGGDASPGTAYFDGFNTAAAVASSTSPIAGASTLTFAGSGLLAGQGVLSGASALTFAPAAAVAGRTALSGASSLTFSTAADLKARGGLAGAAQVSFAPSGAVAGRAALSGASSPSFSLAGAITGRGTLAGASATTFSPAGALGGRGALAGTIAVGFTTAGNLVSFGSAGVLSGSTTIGLTAAGTLAGRGRLAGSIALSFSPAGNVVALLGGISGSAAFSFACSGYLSSRWAPQARPGEVAISTVANPPNAALGSVFSADGYAELVDAPRPPLVALQ